MEVIRLLNRADRELDVKLKTLKSREGNARKLIEYLYSMPIIRVREVEKNVGLSGASALFAQSTLTIKVNEHYPQTPVSGVTLQLQQDGSTATAEIYSSKIDYSYCSCLSKPYFYLFHFLSQRRPLGTKNF